MTKNISGTDIRLLENHVSCLHIFPILYQSSNKKNDEKFPLSPFLNFSREINPNPKLWAESPFYICINEEEGFWVLCHHQKLFHSLSPQCMKLIRSFILRLVFALHRWVHFLREENDTFLLFQKTFSMQRKRPWNEKNRAHKIGNYGAKWDLE